MNPTLLQKKSPPKKSLQWKNLSYTRLKRRGLCSPQVIFQHLHGLDADPWPESKPVRFTPTPCLGTACSETRCKTAAPKGRPRFTSHRLFPLGRICILIPPPPPPPQLVRGGFFFPNYVKAAPALAFRTELDPGFCPPAHAAASSSRGAP